MSMKRLQCGACRADLPQSVYALGAGECAACGAPFVLQVFPAALAPPAGKDAAAPPAMEGESACYYHPSKKAEAVCAASGAFLCRLCAIEVGGQVLSPQAVEEAVRNKALPQFESDRPRYKQQALFAGLVGLAFCLVPLVGTVLGAGAIGLALWGRRKRGCLLDAERGYLAAAILTGALAFVINITVLISLAGAVFSTMGDL